MHGYTDAGIGHWRTPWRPTAGVGSNRIQRLSGLGKRMPIVAFAFVLGGVGLIGVPGTAGFVSKWALLQAAFASEHYVVAGLVLMSSLVAVVYVWRVVEVMYFQAPPVDEKTNHDNLAMVPALILLGASILFGLFPDQVVELAADAAHQLFLEPSSLPPVPVGGHG